jgi:hypothetical protein
MSLIQSNKDTMVWMSKNKTNIMYVHHDHVLITSSFLTDNSIPRYPVSLSIDYELFGSAVDAKLFCGVRATDDAKEELCAGDVFTATDVLDYLFTGIVVFTGRLFALVLPETAIDADYKEAVLCKNLSFLGLRNRNIIKKTSLSQSSPLFARFAAIMHCQKRLLSETFSTFIESRINKDDEQR